jgi:5-methyltetrahydrofolate--homocysteine methyltransferase
MNSILRQIYEGVLEGNRPAVTLKVQEAIQAGVPPEEILDSMTRSMEKVGSLFEEGEYFVPEMLIAARAMQQGMEILRPHLVDRDAKSLGTVLAGTVKGDLHEMGKNLVCMMLECAGFRVMDLGMDVAPEAFVQAVQDNRPAIVAMSALLTTTMPQMKITIDALREAGYRDGVRILVGGAPVTQAYADEIGADGYAKDASEAVAVAKRLLDRT